MNTNDMTMYYYKYKYKFSLSNAASSSKAKGHQCKAGVARRRSVVLTLIDSDVMMDFVTTVASKQAS
jgi:hypothetical protein